MKKISTLLLGLPLLFATSAQAAHETPYTSGLGGDTEWTVIDANNDNKTWTDGDPGTNFANLPAYCTKVKLYTYNSNLAANDWLIGPAVTLEPGKEYKVRYQVHNTYSETMTLYMAKANDQSSLAAGTVLDSFVDAKNVENSKGIIRSKVFTVSEAGDYYFAYHATSKADQAWIRLTDFCVKENVFSPGKPTALTCVPGEERALTATLSWTLPTVDSDNGSLPADATFEAVNVKRDGQLVATLAGDATSWTDDESKGLTPGYHTYEVNVVVNGAASGFTKLDSPYIGPVQAAALPYSFDFKNLTNETFELFWTPVAGRSDNSNKTWETSIAYNGNSIKFNPGSGKSLDNWLISPQMKFEEGGIYKLTTKISHSDSDTKAGLSILFGSGSSIADYEDVVASYDKIGDDKVESIFVEIETPGEYGFAYHVEKESSTYYEYKIQQFDVQQWHESTLPITDLKVEVNDEATKALLTWTNPVKTNVGNTLSALEKVEVYCNDELIETITDVFPGEDMGYEHIPDTNGVFSYYVLPYINGFVPDADPMVVTSSWIGDDTQSLPFDCKFLSSDASLGMWSVLDANADSKTWKVSTGGAVLSKPSTYTKMDDYVVTPNFVLTPGYYKVYTQIKGGEKNLPIQVGVVSDKKNIADSFKSLGSIKLPGNLSSSYYTTIVKVENEGKQAFALRVNDWMSSSAYDITMAMCQISKYSVLPGVATDLSVQPAADLSLEATISWKNPTTTNVDGVAPEITKVEISRGDTLIATLTDTTEPGETYTYTDSEVPNAGEYLYTVKVYGPEGASETAAPTVQSPWIGAGMELPWHCNDGFTDAGWTIHNINNDKNTWGDPVTWTPGTSSLFITSSSTTPNDWAITPRLNMPKGTYKLTFKHYISNGYEPASWEIHAGTGTHYNDMTKGKLATITSSQLSSAAEEVVIMITAEDDEDQAESAPQRVILQDGDEEDPADGTLYATIPAGVTTIGLYANSKGAYGIKSFAIERVVESAVDGVAYDADGVFVANGVVYFNGNASVAAVYSLDGACMKSQNNVSNISLVDLQTGAYVVKAVVNGNVYAVKVIK